MRYHLGCGNHRLSGYVNVDLVETIATDYTCDLTEFQPAAPADAVFSSAFFEHLRRFAQVPHLASLRRALTTSGFVCYLGLPDFERTAQVYLSGGPGVVGAEFDLFNAYRLTHGDPEMAQTEEAWYAQLHKSLFDVSTVMRLLSEAAFPSFVVFRYAFPADGLDLMLGFYASGAHRPTTELQSECLSFLRDLGEEYTDLDTVQFLDGRSRLSIMAKVTGTRGKRNYPRRVAYAVATRLARM
jgi:predicted SAM-dependent methyltransferase